MNVSSEVPAEIDLQVAEHGPDVRVVTVAGQIDVGTVWEMSAFLMAQLTVSRVVILDLDGVIFLGSSGLSALFEANELAIQQDHVLLLVCNSRSANRALAAAGLREYFIFSSSIADAVTGSAPYGTFRPRSACHYVDNAREKRIAVVATR
ncbi:MAG: STAS domain-containing protein [Pseudonocardiaceae bacterium]